MSLFAATTDRIFGFMGYVRAKPADEIRYENRSSVYAVNDQLYQATAYNTRTNGGFLEDVLKRYVGAGYTDTNTYPIYPFFMPFAEIADCYQNVWPGTWGDGMDIADKTDGKPINAKLRDPLELIWRDSNLDTEKESLVRWAANLGTVGLRVRGLPAEGTNPARALIQVDKPDRLFNFEEDSRGNVTAVVLKYEQVVNFGTLVNPDWQTVEVVEQISKDEFSKTFDGEEQIEDANRANALGFCPYVILRHKDNGTPYGDWAYKGSEAVIHRINWRLSRQDKSIDRHQFPKWFGAAGGKKPTTVEMGDTSMSYVEMTPDTPPPMLQAIVAQVDQAATQNFWMGLRDLLRTRQPELNFNDVKLLANISGEALAQVLKPVEQCILRRRPGYDHALRRALQMAVSAGVAVGAWDVGTGAGSAEVADAAYKQGFEDFTFAERPALPLTPQQRLTIAQAQAAEKANEQPAQPTGANPRVARLLASLNGDAAA